jgi:hypothetical protein
MAAYALNSTHEDDTTLFLKIQSQLVHRYDVDPKLASEMAWDLVEVLSAIDGNVEILEKYFLQ